MRFGMAMNDDGLSVLSVDLGGGGRLAGSLNQEEIQYVLGRCEKRIRHVLENHGGRLVRQAGSNLTAFFSDGGQALQAGIDIQHRVADLPRYAGQPLAVRVGVCSGHQTAEARFFSGDGPNPAASLSAMADPAHILLSLPRRLKLLPRLLLAADGGLDLPLSCGKRQLGICQIAWQDGDPHAVRSMLSDIGRTADCLYLHHRGMAQHVDERQSFLTVGRQPDSDIVLRDARCSRLHGRIERRFDHFFFVDRSANGTYLVLDEQIEIFVHNKEQALFGRGCLYLGAPSSAKGVESIRFQTSPP
ncbi:hypothetical protein AT959_00495 [Dechloromonas denitrificans]|uniref:FHA domain-containing protein n=2 Tax=Dechloromonas denitrificans TaxID=281362 RepID=A0A133XP52_9RHOO|nr:hypothetical protein AT959_00495 [Dechloromonas denitrificans]